MRKSSISLFVGSLICITVVFAQNRSRALSLPAGTPIDVRLNKQIESGTAHDGDTFTATVAAPVSAQGRTVLSKNSQVTGRVVSAVSSGRLQRPAALTLELIQAGSNRLTTEPVVLDGKSHTGRDVALIGGGAAAGALIGGLAGGGKGAAIGAAAGAGAGTATAYFTGKKELVLPPEMAIRFVVAGSPASVSSTTPTPAAPAPTSSSGRPGRERTEDGAIHRGDPVTVFSPGDQKIITHYMSVNRSNLPPGLANRDRLPPGLEKQLQRNGTLPPGLQKRVQPFPPELDRQLPPVPAGASRVFLGGRALLLDQAQRVLDMFSIN